MLHEFLLTFLTAVQEVINYDLTVIILIDINMVHMVLERLFEQTDAAIRQINDENDEDDPENKKPKEIFSRQNRINLLVAIFNQSIIKKMFDIPYEVTMRFMSDLLKAKYLPVFDGLFTQFKEDTSRYEAKLALINNCIPLMNKSIAAKFMKVIESVLQEPAANSFLKNNTNPLRCGLMLHRVLVEISEEHGYSEHSTNIMKHTLDEQMVKMLEMYTDPDEMMILVEQTDYFGHDCLWYLDEYDMYSILDCRIMDRVIQKKWSGKYDVNASILDYSTCSQLISDKHGLFATNRVFAELNHEMLNLDKRDKTHRYKFHCWKYSMQLRFQIEGLFVAALTFSF